MTLRAKSAVLCGAFVAAVAGCTPPVRQYDLRNQTLTCDQVNEYTYGTLKAMGFAITEFTPAAVGSSGTVRGTRADRGTQSVTAVITCDGKIADVTASEDGKWLGQLEFKRGFYLTFTAIAAQAAVTEAAARAEARRPLQAKKGKGLHVLLKPVQGLGAKLDFDLDLAAAGVLPVQIVINNATPRTYNFDPADIVLIAKDGTRVPPMPVAEAAERATTAARQQAAAGAAAAPDAGTVSQRLQARLLTGNSVAPNQILKGYLFFPLRQYVKGRVSLEDQESEETEGFIVEF